MPKRRTVRPLADISMSGVIQLVAMYSEHVSRVSYTMSNITSIPDAKIQQFLDEKVEWFKTFLFSGKCFKQLIKHTSTRILTSIF